MRSGAAVLSLSLAACAGVPGFTTDWRLDACFANQPGVTIVETFAVEHVRDLVPRMRANDRASIGAGTDDRPAFVVRMRGKFDIVAPKVGPVGGGSFHADDPTCVIVLEADGTFPEGSTPLFIGPLSGG